MSQSYTREDRINAMRAAGWPEAVIPVGVAVSLAESYDGRGINNNPPTEYSVGPWQINLLAHKNITESQAQDLNYSTAYALNLWKTQGFQPWGAFTSGAYTRYVEPVPVNNQTTNVVPNGVQSPDAKDRNIVSGSGGVQSPDAVDRNKSINATNAPISLGSFAFPTVDLGPIKLDTSPLFKLALSVGALFLVFKGLNHIAE